MAHRHFMFDVTSCGLLHITHSYTINHKSVHLSVDSEFLNIKKWWHVNITCILNFFILNSLLTYRIQNRTNLPIMLSICKSWGKPRSGQILPKCEPLLVIYWFPKARLQNTTTRSYLEVRKYRLLFKFLMQSSLCFKDYSLLNVYDFHLNYVIQTGLNHYMNGRLWNSCWYDAIFRLEQRTICTVVVWVMVTGYL